MNKHPNHELAAINEFKCRIGDKLKEYLPMGVTLRATSGKIAALIGEPHQEVAIVLGDMMEEGVIERRDSSSGDPTYTRKL